MSTDFDTRKQLRQEAGEVIDFLKSAYPTIGKRDFFQQAVLRSLAVIIKLLTYTLTRD